MATQYGNSGDHGVAGRDDTVGAKYEPKRMVRDPATGMVWIEDNTLRDVIEDELLCPAATWLLGYRADLKDDAGRPVSFEAQRHDHPNARIRPQAEDSHWLTGLTVVFLRDAREILARDPQKLAQTPTRWALVEEIDRRLQSDDRTLNPVTWLLDQAQPLPNGQFRWYGTEYDTAVVTASILRLIEPRKNTPPYPRLPGGYEKYTNDRLQRALAWLDDGLGEAIERAKGEEEAIEAIEPFVVAHGGPLSRLLPRRQGADRFYDYVDDWLSFLEAQAGTDEHGASTEANTAQIEQGSARGQQLQSVVLENTLTALVYASQRADANTPSATRLADFARRARKLLLTYLDQTEKAISTEAWTGSLSRVQRLGAYVDATEALRQAPEMPASDGDQGHFNPEQHPAKPEIVLKMLSLAKSEFFKNGSVFHSVYPTIYFARALVSIWNWSGSGKTIGQLNQDLLSNLVVKESLERTQMFELQKKLADKEKEVEQQRERLKKKEARDRVFFFAFAFGIVLALSGTAIMYGGSFLIRSDFIQLLGAVVSGAALLLLLFDALVLRGSEE